MGLTATGIGSGLDVTGLVSQLMEVEKQPLLKLASRQASYQAKISALGLVKGSLSSLQTAVAALKDPGKFSATKVTVGAGAGFTATSSASAATGSYAVQVEQLATQQLTSFRPTDNGGYALQFSNASGIRELNATSLDQLRDAINADASLGVSATLIDADGVDGVDSLSLKARAPGMSNAFSVSELGYAGQAVSAEQAAGPDLAQITRFSPTANANGELSVTIGDKTYTASDLAQLQDAIEKDNPLALSVSSDVSQLVLTGEPNVSFAVQDNYAARVWGAALPNVQEARDARLTIDGVSVTRSSNTISDLVQGVTFNLTGRTDAAADLTVSRNDAVATSAINAFVSAYNSFLATSREQTAYDAASNKASTLTGDATLRRMQDQLRTLITAEIDGPGGVRRLNDIGVTFQADGKLSVDSSKLSAVLADPALDVAKFFVGSSDSGASSGFAATLSDRLDAFLKVGGSLATRTDALGESVKLLEKQSEAFNLRLTMIEARYMKQFSALDSILSNMTATSSFLTQQIDGWNATANSAKA